MPSLIAAFVLSDRSLVGACLSFSEIQTESVRGQGGKENTWLWDETGEEQKNK
jgi:hypothetical protein